MNAAAVARLFPLLLLAGCAAADPNCAAFSGGRYCLQPSTGVAPFEATQKVELRFREHRETVIAEIEVDAAGMRMAGLTPFGQKLLQFNWDNRELKATTVPDARFDAAFLAATLQLAHWPADAVRAGLSAPLRLEETAGGRRVLKNSTPVLSIQLDGERPPYRSVRMAMPAADLEMLAETLDTAGARP
jgi:hypothetical protein